MEVGATIYKETAPLGEAAADVLCLRVRSVDLLVAL